MTPKKELLETYKQMAKDSDFPSMEAQIRENYAEYYMEGV